MALFFLDARVNAATLSQTEGALGMNTIVLLTFRAAGLLLVAMALCMIGAVARAQAPECASPFARFELTQVETVACERQAQRCASPGSEAEARVCSEPSLATLDFQREVVAAHVAATRSDERANSLDWPATRDRCQQDQFCIRDRYERSIRTLQQELRAPEAARIAETNRLQLNLLALIVGPLAIGLLTLFVLAKLGLAKSFRHWLSFSSWRSLRALTFLMLLAVTASGAWYLHARYTAYITLLNTPTGDLADDLATQYEAQSNGSDVHEPLAEDIFVQAIAEGARARSLEEFWPGYWLDVAIVCVGLLIIGAVALWVIVKAGQKQRDARANFTMSELESGRKPKQPMILYLRSFRLDEIFGDQRLDALAPLPAPRRAGRARGAVIVYLILAITSWMVIDFLQRRKQLEYFLRGVIARLPSKTITCSLGESQGVVGFGRVSTSDEVWQHQVSLLLNESALIILMFGNTLGTSWELARILDGPLLHKAVFLIPPTTALRAQQEAHAVEIEKDYTVFRDQMRAGGYSVPDYKPGLAFILDQQSKAISSVDLGFLSRQRTQFEPWLRDVYSSAFSSPQRELN